MSLPQEALQRLAQLGYTAGPNLQFWQSLWQSQGESFFWGFLQAEEHAAVEYRLWFPRLQEFAAECRRATPVPSVDSLSPAEREQHRILLAKMEEFAKSEDSRCVFGPKPNQAAILTTTRVGLPAASHVFAGTDAVLLLEEEKERWFAKVYPGVGERFWWYSFAWWSLREGLSAWDEGHIRESYPLPPGGSYWSVACGVQWGSLAGGENAEVWCWDGTTATPLGISSVSSF